MVGLRLYHDWATVELDKTWLHVAYDVIVGTAYMLSASSSNLLSHIAEYLAMRTRTQTTLFISTGSIWCEQGFWDWNFLRLKITNGDRCVENATDKT